MLKSQNIWDNGNGNLNSKHKHYIS